MTHIKMNSSVCLVLLIICVIMVTSRPLGANYMKRTLQGRGNNGGAQGVESGMGARGLGSDDTTEKRLKQMVSDLDWIKDEYDIFLSDKESAEIQELRELLNSLIAESKQSDTQSTSTQPPTTQPSTTKPLITKPPTTQLPTTQPPTTQPPTTKPPTTQPPTTQQPTTLPPTRQLPTTQLPTTQQPTTQPPTTQLPTTQPPATQPPTTQATTISPNTDEND